MSLCDNIKKLLYVGKSHPDVVIYEVIIVTYQDVTLLHKSHLMKLRDLLLTSVMILVLQ